MTIDERRVDVVDNVLAVALLGHDKRRDWARAAIAALDVYDANARLHDGRGNLTWFDETEPDE